MSKFFDDTMQGLLEAIEINNGNVPLKEKDNMPAPTFYVEEKDQKLIEELTNIRKQQNISQKRLAELTGYKQQAISRLEKKENSPSLKSFINILDALGYDLQIVKRTT